MSEGWFSVANRPQAKGGSRAARTEEGDSSQLVARAVPLSVTLRLHCQPGAKRSEIQGLHGAALKIRLAAPPVDGKANEALLTFLSRHLGIPQRDVELVSGPSSRHKVVRVTGVSMDQILALPEMK